MSWQSTKNRYVHLPNTPSPRSFDALVRLIFLTESCIHRHKRWRNRKVGHQNVVSQPKGFTTQSVQVKFCYTPTSNSSRPTIGRHHGRSTGTLRPQIPSCDRILSNNFIPWPRELVQPKTRLSTFPTRLTPSERITKRRIQAFAVDPSERFIFAAGQDKVIRAWSISTGQLLRDASDAGAVAGESARLLNTRFEEGISDMQLVDSGGCGLGFWYSTGSALCNQTIL